MNIVKKSYSKTQLNGDKINVSVQDPDRFTGLSVLEIETQVFDHYNEKMLAPRTSKFFLTKKDIANIGRFLVSVSEE